MKLKLNPSAKEFVPQQYSQPQYFKQPTWTEQIPASDMWNYGPLYNRNNLYQQIRNPYKNVDITPIRTGVLRSDLGNSPIIYDMGAPGPNFYNNSPPQAQIKIEHPCAYIKIYIIEYVVKKVLYLVMNVDHTLHIKIHIIVQ